MAERPSLGRDDSYNRVSLGKDFKSQIMGMINDSSESLPLSTLAESDDDEEQTPATKTDKNHLAPPNANGQSKLQESMAASDFPTPTPEKPNPLEQVPTVREPSPSKNTDGVDPVLAQPSPVRSHEVIGPGSLTAKLPKILNSAAMDSCTDVDGNKETLGTTASRATTVSQTPSVASGKKEGGKNRPGLAKRMSTAIRRTVSKQQSPEKERTPEKKA